MLVLNSGRCHRNRVGNWRNIGGSAGSGHVKEAVEGNLRVHLCNEVNEIPIAKMTLLVDVLPI